MKKYLQIDTGNKVTSVQEQQNVEGTLILKDISDEQMQNIFEYKIIGGNLVLDINLYKKRKFNDLNNEIIFKLMYVKKLKKLDDVKNLFIDEYKKNQTSIAEVDASIALIRTDLFEV